MSEASRDLSDEEVRLLAGEMDRTGYAVLPGYVSAAQVDQARAFVQQESAKRGNEYFAYVGPGPVAETLPGELGGSHSFKRILTRLYTMGTGKPAPSLPIYQVLRCVLGLRGLAESYRFHFDGYVVTALLPLVIPSGSGLTGDLLLFPNVRLVRRFGFLNVLEKGFYQNRFSQRVVGWLTRRDLVRPVVLRLVPGNIYLFWGYRSLHANAPCDVSRLRTTALFHFGDPHSGSGLVGLVHSRASGRGFGAGAG